MDSCQIPICGYCKQHRLKQSEIFLERPLHICRCCGTDLEKEKIKAAKDYSLRKERSAEWGTSIPDDFTSRTTKDDKHTPSVAQSWLPSWLRAEINSKGFTYDDPRTLVDASLEANPSLSFQVSSLWRSYIYCCATCFSERFIMQACNASIVLLGH